MRLEAKVAIVTGGSQGIGAAIARRFAKEGAAVVIGDVLEDNSKAIEGELRSKGYKVSFVPLDVTDEGQWDNIVKVTEDLFGHLSILVNNAGTTAAEPIGETSLETWNKVMDVNSTGVFLGTRAGIRAMKPNGVGSIINISSIYGNVGSSGAGAYHASKGSVRLISKSAAVTYAKDNVRVNTVHPGFIKTPMSSVFSDTEKAAFASLHPMGRFGQPEEVANACLFLASDEASFVTGSELMVDGGYTAQ